MATPEGLRITIGAALHRATRRLADTSPSPRLDAEILLGHVLAKPRTFLRGWPEAVLSDAHRAAFEDLIARRRAGTPIAYLTGVREFWSREFIVTPDVLIPRPETELLVELALEQLSDKPGATVLDLATGSGAIAVTLALEDAAAEVYASDVSAAALAIARRNAERHGARVRFLESDWFAGFPDGLAFDLIVSNPPYIPESDPHLREGDVRFEPRLALEAGADGLDAYRIIASQARSWLRPRGLLLLEHGYDQAGALEALLGHHGYGDVTHYPDLQGHTRITRAARPPH